MSDTTDTERRPDEDLSSPPPQPLDPGDGPKMNAGVGHLDGNATFANVLNQNHFFAPTSEMVSFSPEMATVLDESAEKELLALVTMEEERVELLLQHIEQQRVLVVCGDRGAGKATAGRYLATLLAERKELRHPTYVVGTLEQRVRILLREIAADRERFGSRVMIFRDAFELKNKDLLSFFSSDASDWAHLRAALTANDAYLVFTTTHVDFDVVRRRVPDRVACVDFAAVPEELTPVALDRKLLWLEQQNEVAPERLEIVRRHRQQLVTTLRTVPRVMAAVNEFLHGAAELETVLQRHATRSSSLLQELERDVDAWCFAMALALTQAAAPTPIAWSDFEHLRRLLTEKIRRDPEMFPPRRNGEGRADEVPERTVAASLCDDALVDRCRAHITKDSAGLRDMVSFREKECAERIWTALLQRHRRVLAAIVPVLRAVAGDDSFSISLRMLTAETLGRIGAVDPRSITLPLIQQWSTTGGPLVGALLRGVLASGVPRYQEVALAALEGLAIAGAENADAQTRERLVTVISAYSQLTDYPAARAMEHLGDIAIQYCAPSMAEVYEILLHQEKVAREELLVLSKRRAAALRARRRLLADRVDGKLAAQVPLLEALQLGLMYLCVMHDDVQTLNATRNWISKGGIDTAMLVSLLFLHDGGIADQLDEYSVEVESDGGTASIHPLVISVASSRTALHDLCGFLCDVYTSIERKFALPAAMQQLLLQRFDACLTAWARGAARAPVFRQVVEELFGALAIARGSVMRRRLFALAGTPEFQSDDAMRSFAAGARRRMDS